MRGCFVHLRDLDLGSGNWPFYRCFAVKRGSTACIYDPRFTRSRGCTWVWFKIQETRGIYLLPQKTVSRTTSSYLIAMLVKRCRLCLTASLVGPMSFPNQHVLPLGHQELLLLEFLFTSSDPNIWMRIYLLTLEVACMLSVCNVSKLPSYSYMGPVIVVFTVGKADHAQQYGTIYQP